jgi:membrane protein implicated in regulation of membrane protease activity
MLDAKAARRFQRFWIRVVYAVRVGNAPPPEDPMELEDVLRIEVRPGGWFVPILYVALFGVLLPAAALLALVAFVVWLASGNLAAGIFDLVLFVILAVPAYFGGRSAWTGARRRPPSQLVISPVGVLTGGEGSRVSQVPWNKITDVRIRPYGARRRPTFLVSAKDVGEAYRAVAGIRAGQSFTVYAIPMSRLRVDQAALAQAVQRYSQGRLTLS